MLSHLAEPAASVAEMARVLKRHGRLGISSWAGTPGDTPPGRVWQQHLEAQLGVAECEAVTRQQLPSEALLSDPKPLELLLARAGLEVQTVVVQPFNISISTADFVSSRSVSAPARRLQERLSKTAWNAFLADVSADLIARFGHRVVFVLRACLVRGMRGWAV